MDLKLNCKTKFERAWHNISGIENTNHREQVATHSESSRLLKFFGRLVLEASERGPAG